MKRLATAALLVGLILAATGFLVRETFFRPLTITAYFPSATGIYAGDDIRVSGVKVGSVSAVQAQPKRAKLVLHVDRRVPIPADAKAVIVSQNLVAARYVQLTPAYRTSGPKMRDGAVIDVDRTAVPVEWDEVTAQLTRLATDLGPSSPVSTTAVSRFIDSAANAMDGNGEKLRRALAQLSGISRILANGSGNIVDIITNLQNFVTTLRESNQQIVQFQNRLATLSSVINDSRSDLDAALSNLSVAVGEVQRFVAGSRDKTAEQIQRLTNVTQVLVDHHMDVENILHAAPTAFANGYNIYNPNTPGAMGSFIINNFSNPTQFICGAIGAAENVTAAETGKLCGQYLGPGLRTANFNYLPIPTNLILQQIATPGKIIYAEPRLAPGGDGPKPGPPEEPPAISAYTGLGDSAPKTLPELLLPGQGAPPP
ncbi:mammalian cell entry protein [Mycobacterium paraense]|uniref:Mammalian cell entry protein n=1 Tax=Mycobacterium paraense TaxID=767916 RepID=A0ABX3VQJ9_9MYCO|nr:MCE family protein [Mycobacterium paraense]ORW32524.1 mammalian cell entry protein [Mycobacterium paraense]ORW37872.1 mammalian cell entry protein [Mycobacterium paraense]